MCQKLFERKFCCALRVFLCALVSRPVCARTCTQLRGNIGCEYLEMKATSLCIHSLCLRKSKCCLVVNIMHGDRCLHGTLRMDLIITSYVSMDTLRRVL